MAGALSSGRLMLSVALALVCALPFACQAEELQVQPAGKAEAERQQVLDVPLASKIGLLHKSMHWGLENLSRGSSSSRDRQKPSAKFTSEIEMPGGFQQAQQQQQQFACGRALANRNNKYPNNLNNNFLDKHGHELSASRSKYRPFEIRTPRIIGGDETNPGEFPWTVSIKLNGQPICGGSLISRSWILTAAHCVVGYNPKNLTVRLGAHRIKDPNEPQVVDSPISLFIVHKQYSMPRPFSNDIALLKMAEPLEYSEFIIPICLPTEDQSPTRVDTNDLEADYLPKVATSGTTTSVPLVSEDFETSDGIVVSTKMSDKEISKCFKRLEQNYLNSIGLGTSGQSANGDGASTTLASPAIPDKVDEQDQNQDTLKVQLQQQKEKNFLMPPMPIDMIPAKMTNQLGENNAQSANSKPGPVRAADSNSLLGPLFITTNNNENSQQNVVAANTHLYETHTVTNNNDKINFPAFSDFNNFEQAQAAQNQPLAITNNQHRASWSKQQLVAQDDNSQVLMSNQHQAAVEAAPVAFAGDQQGSFAAAVPWNQRRAETVGKMAGEQQQQQKQARNSLANLNGAGLLGAGNENKAIKLTSLPISKELLREIQSVGSMQSLSLGLQQGDFLAMANDLGVAQPSGYAADRERVLVTPRPAYASGNKQVVRDTELLTNELQTNEPAGGEPTKYSGMMGIVVGWGWVRENDNDAETAAAGLGAGQRSFQSVTLQKVRLPILRNSDCEAWFRSQEKKITLLPSQFCAGYNSGGKDACRGDSGGPMIIEDSSDTGRYKLIGIVSAGIGCARPSLPGLYTRVASFLPWIQAQMQNH